MSAPAGIIETLAHNKSVYTNPFINIDVDDVRFPNGVEGKYSVVSNAQKKGAVIIPFCAYRGMGYFGLVRQYRYPVKEFTLEFPRGGTDDLEESDARIEITEELGQDAKRLVRVGTIWPDTGILTTEVGVWIAVMDPSVLESDHIEGITGLKPEWTKEAVFDGMVLNGKIRCGMTLAAYTFFKLNRGRFGAMLEAL